jgi:D-aminoacyl-tRNA deacylase
VWVGHLLANYALSFDEQTTEEGLPSGPWRHAVTIAIESTRIAFPGGSVFAHLDRKSFKGWQRQALASLLSELEVPILRGKQIP